MHSDDLQAIKKAITESGDAITDAIQGLRVELVNALRPERPATEGEMQVIRETQLEWVDKKDAPQSTGVDKIIQDLRDQNTELQRRLDRAEGLWVHLEAALKRTPMRLSYAANDPYRIDAFSGRAVGNTLPEAVAKVLGIPHEAQA